jgi:cysteine desulfurase
MAALRDSLQAEMCALAPSAIVYGAAVARLPNTLSLGLPGVDQQRQVMALDLAGVAVSAGSACSSGKVAPSAVLLAMGASEEQARQTIRVSLGPQTTAADCAALLSAWAPLARAAAL